MKKSLILIIFLAFILEMGCQNGHKNQSWQPGSPKKAKSKRR